MTFPSHIVWHDQGTSRCETILSEQELNMALKMLEGMNAQSWFFIW